MSRPRGQIRQVVASVFREQGACTWRTVAESAQVGYAAARRTVENMVRAGELVEAGHAKAAHTTNWVKLYELRQPTEAEQGTASELSAVVRCWAEFR